MSEDKHLSDSRPNFFIGIVETAGITLELSRGLREKGYEVRNVVQRPKSAIIPLEGHDGYINKSNMARYWGDIFRIFLSSFNKYDYFVFNSCVTFFQGFPFLKNFQYIGHPDLILLRAMGKKIIIFATGTDLRSYPRLVEDLSHKKFKSHAKYLKKDLESLSGGGESENQKTVKAQVIERFADEIFSQPVNAQRLKRDYHYLWVPLDLSKMKFRINDRDRLVVAHAPSKRQIKGTEYVLKAVDKLRSEGLKFEFQLFENMPNDILRGKLSNTDVIIDQLLLPGIGTIGLEGMATGNVILSSAIPGYNGPDELPVVTCTPDNLYDKLKKVLKDRGLRLDLMNRGLKFVKKYHATDAVVNDFLKKLDLID